MKFYLTGPGHMTKMTAIPSKIELLQNRKDDNLYT